MAQVEPGVLSEQAAGAPLVRSRRHGIIRRARLTGIALFCSAILCFALLDTTAKYLGQLGVPTLQIVWGRYFGHVVVVVLFMRPWSHPNLLRSHAPRLEIVRALLLLSSTVLNFSALRWLSLTETTSIMFAAPLVVAAVAGPLLGEWIGPRRWVAVLVGFFGVLIVVKPGGGLHPAMFLSMAAMLGYAFYLVSTSKLSHTDSASTMLLYSGFVALIAITPTLLFVWETPTVFEAALMALTGLLGAFGHFLLIRAHKLAPTSTLSPFSYTQMIWMTALGFLIFGNLPGWNTAIGSGVIVASGLYLLWRERVTGQQT